MFKYPTHAGLLLCLCLILHATFLLAQINTPAGASIPFGSNITYPGNALLPTNLPNNGTYQHAQDAADAYHHWKTNYVESCGGTPERFRVKFDNASETVSEGIAYGMLLAAYAADKALFDGLWAYYKNFSNGNGVMNWKINGCSGVIGSGGAADAELDAAMALLVAHHQWPASTTPHDYQADVTALINAIKDHEIQPANANGTYQTNNGDQWGFGNDCRNPSYQSPAYYKAYGEFLTDQAGFWDNCTQASYTLLNANAHPTTGLVSNWSTPNGNPNGCNGPNEFGWDACRNPWRMGTDVAWYSDAEAATLCNKMAAWIQGVGVSNLRGPVPQNGVGGSYHSPAFISTWAVGVMGANSSYQPLLNSLYTETVATMDSPPYYFGNTLRVISLFNLTGNFWKPNATIGNQNNAPTAFIVANPTTGDAPLFVNFDGSSSTDADGDPLTYAWDFGDNNSDNNAITQHMFTTPGVYTVTLTVDDGNGGINAETITITVIDNSPQPPTAQFTAQPTNGGVPLTVSFNAADSSDPNGDALTYTWDFGDGNTGTGVTIQHTYTAIGTYTATLTVADGNGGTATETVTITVTNTPPEATFSATPTTGEAPLPVSFDASGSTDANGDALTYSWDFGDGQTGTGVTINHTYQHVGTYTATLTVEDGHGGRDTFNTTITVTNTGGGGSGSCALSLQYRTSDNNSSGATDNQVRPHFKVYNHGSDPIDLATISIRYWYTKEGTADQQAWIDYARIGNQNVTTNFVRLGTPVAGADHYLEVGFTANAGAIEAGQHSGPVQTRFAKTNWSNYEEQDDYSYNATANTFQTWDKVTVYCNGVLAWGTEPDGTNGGDGGGGEDTNQPPVAALTATPTSGTAPLVVQFDATNSSDPDGDVLTYSWDFGDGQTGTGLQTSPTYQNAGSYTATLTVTDEQGNSSTDQTTITVDEPIGGTGDVEIIFTVNNVWNKGYCAGIEIVNHSNTTINGWELAFTLEATINNLWKADWQAAGNHYTAANKSWNAKIKAGQSRDFGFCANHTGVVTPPTNGSFNGSPITFTYINNNKASNNTKTLAPPAHQLWIQPNITNESTTLRYQLTTAGRVHIQLFDQTGQWISDLVDAPHAEGEHNTVIDIKELASGQYFVRLLTGETTVVKRLLVIN